MEPLTILVIDDEQDVLDLVRDTLAAAGRRILCHADPVAALALMQAQHMDIVLTDLKMPGRSGLEVLAAVKADSPETEVVLLTGHGAIESSVLAMKGGADDFLTKPIRQQALLEVVARLAERQARRKRLREESDSGVMPVGNSQAMQRVLSLARVVAESDATALILGETGVGKEVLADYIQRHSARVKAPYIKVNCTALSETLLESELFGHERGAFTGAAERRTGRFERAHGGTLFLDEITEIPPDVQVKLLRVLQNHVIERVGSSQPIQVNFRLMAATHRDLQAAVREGKFREDLYYRINVFPVTIPPLRERAEDIPGLARHFLLRARAKLDRGPEEIHPDALQMLMAHTWPGNVRELENTIERACILARGETLTPSSICLNSLGTASAPPCATGCGSLEPVAHAAPSALSAGLLRNLPETIFESGNPLEAAERATLVEAIQRCRWNFSETASMLKISRSTLYSKTARYGIAKT